MKSGRCDSPCYSEQIEVTRSKMHSSSSATAHNYSTRVRHLEGFDIPAFGRLSRVQTRGRAVQLLRALSSGFQENRSKWSRPKYKRDIVRTRSLQSRARSEARCAAFSAKISPRDKSLWFGPRMSGRVVRFTIASHAKDSRASSTSRLLQEKASFARPWLQIRCQAARFSRCSRRPEHIDQN